MITFQLQISQLDVMPVFGEQMVSLLSLQQKLGIHPIITAPQNFLYEINSDDTVIFSWDAIDDGQDYEYLVYYQEEGEVSN